MFRESLKVFRSRMPTGGLWLRGSLSTKSPNREMQLFRTSKWPKQAPSEGDWTALFQQVSLGRTRGVARVMSHSRWVYGERVEKTISQRFYSIILLSFSDTFG